MAPFDASVSLWANGLIGIRPALDVLLVEIAENTLVKGTLPMAIVWSLWWRDDAGSAARRAQLLGALIACFVAVLVARGCSLLLPFHVRPMHEPSLHLTIAEGLVRDAADGWSSLPSDNAAFFFGIAFGIARVSPRLGALALAHALLVVCGTRLVLGVHYASDLAAGAAIGLLAAAVCTGRWARERLFARASAYGASHPQWFFPLLFVLTAEIADLLVPLRDLARVGFRILH